MQSEGFVSLYGVNKQDVLNFWYTSLREAAGSNWTRLHHSVQAYLVTVLAHFCLEAHDRKLMLSDAYKPMPDEFRQFADLRQVAEMMMNQFAASPAWMESAGAHILLYAGFFRKQQSRRYNLSLYTQIGKNCYSMAAVGEREKVLRRVASDFDRHLADFANLHQYLRYKRYLIS